MVLYKKNIFFLYFALFVALLILQKNDTSYISYYCWGMQYMLNLIWIVENGNLVFRIVLYNYDYI